jgi:hypothetical protein
MRQAPFNVVWAGLFALTLFGCERLGSNPASREGFWTMFQSNEARAAKQAKAHSDRCRSLGLKPGTEDYKICQNRLRAYGAREPLL